MIRVTIKFKDHEYTADFNQRVILIGRPGDAQPDLDLSFDGTISRTHAKLFINDDGIWINDLGSKWGTFVNGKRISAAVQIPDETTVRMGETEITFRPNLMQPTSASIKPTPEELPKDKPKPTNSETSDLSYATMLTYQEAESLKVLPQDLVQSEFNTDTSKCPMCWAVFGVDASAIGTDVECPACAFKFQLKESSLSVAPELNAESCDSRTESQFSSTANVTGQKGAQKVGAMDKKKAVTGVILCIVWIAICVVFLLVGMNGDRILGVIIPSLGVLGGVVACFMCIRGGFLKFCSNCGKKTKRDEDKCMRCGAIFVHSPDLGSSSNDSFDNWMFYPTILGVISGVILMFFGDKYMTAGIIVITGGCAPLCIMIYIGLWKRKPLVAVFMLFGLIMFLFMKCSGELDN